MKILIVLFASFFGFGLAVQETVSVDKPAEVITVKSNVPATEVERPVMDVMLDTVEISVVAPAAIAAK
ncbi:hypothetical protein CLV24_101363 [Pontibacter ummariensis]|uniref:Uncharacterized protein n=1 Tax=Pontibacter ummariensis TaxID=1610492 RepID=A0A239BHP7_9BACT|nr:hypothetical protein [Pontibacter ummariensis]PRY16517.1 hypothetical protein CLV24_101363 [Pontibacter ummariensis]SNS06563.1 hypothetical protein SAMN06296052_101363 [Pontibacter ummariensis]